MDKKLKIAFFVNAFPVISETFITNQIAALLRDGHEVHIYAQTRIRDQAYHPGIHEYELIKKTRFIDEYPKSRIKKIPMLLFRVLQNPQKLQLIYKFLRKHPGKESLSVYQLLPFLDRHGYDVLHAHFGIAGNYVSSLRNCGLFDKARFITTFHGYDLFAAPGLYKQLFATCDVITVNSKYAKQKLLELGCSQDKICILPVGLDTKTFKRSKPANEQDNTLTLLFVGRLIKLKGPQLFINICDLLMQDNVSFRAILAGDGELYCEISDMINTAGLAKHVEMAGAKTQDEIIGLMDRADIFILPGITDENRAEAQGLVIQEAQAMQLPVIISDAGGMKEGIVDGVTGFVVKEFDTKIFVDKIKLLTNNAELRKQMGIAGRKFVESNYDSKILNKKLLSIYCDNEAIMN